ncbi:MAG: Crp/Fnr family transcriptional regulator [Saccharofermentans sp.]|nr:Crp/Fnr family transcriptional regulator [Saccharofermentans sp.]
MDKELIIKRLSELAKEFNRDLPYEMIVNTVEISRFKEFAKGEIISRVGDDASCAGIIVNGCARSFYIDKDGNDITQAFAIEGVFCMSSGMIGFKKQNTTWEALEDVTVMIFEVKKMKELIMSNERLMRMWINVLEEDARFKIYRESSLLIENATQRYLDMRENAPELCNRIPQRYIATYIGIAPESLCRIRRNLKEQ